GQTALMWAAAENHAETVETLLEAGADLKARTDGGFTALLFAARAGGIHAAKAPLDAGADVNDTIQTGAPRNASAAPPRPAPHHACRRQSWPTCRTCGFCSTTVRIHRFRPSKTRRR